MNWEELILFIEESLGKKPQDIKSVLYLIGVQELGKGFKAFSKEEKQDLIHVGVCRLLSERGYYEFRGKDEEGWPHYELQTGLPEMKVEFQEELMKELAVGYFQKMKNESNHL